MPMATSARSKAGRNAEPPKITSSISPPRSPLADCSPMTQRNASTILDLPQPFGPTIPVRPEPISSSIESENDLKPLTRRRVNSKGRTTIYCRYPALYHYIGRCQSNCQRPGSNSLVGMFLNQLGEFIDGLSTCQLFAIDDKGRRRADIEFLLSVKTRL